MVDGSEISPIAIDSEIPEIRFHPSFRLIVSSLIGKPVMILIPALGNRNQYPSP